MAKIYATDNRYDSGVIKVFLVNDSYDADLCFYKVNDAYEAENKDEYWYFTDNSYDASAVIYWTDDRYDADIIVCRTDDKYNARWNKGNKFVGRLG